MKILYQFMYCKHIKPKKSFYKSCSQRLQIKIIKVDNTGLNLTVFLYRETYRSINLAFDEYRDTTHTYLKNNQKFY